MLEDAWAQGRAHVRKMRQHGFSDHQIREMAVARGWTDKQVAQLLIPVPPPPPPPPPPQDAPAPQTPMPPYRSEVLSSEAPVGRPAALAAVVVLADIAAVLSFIASFPGAVAIVAGGMIAGLDGAPGMRALLLPILFINILAGLCIPIVGYFLWHGWRWARVAFMALLGLSILAGLLNSLLRLAMGGSVGPLLLPLMTMAAYGLFIYMLNGREARAHCVH